MKWRVPSLAGLAICTLLACLGFARADECKLGKYGTLPVEMVGERATTQVKINGVDTRFILDTGAQFNFMSRANADALGLRRTPLPFGMYGGGIGGSFSEQLATVKDFGMLGADFHRVQFLVGGTDSGEGLLGASLLDAVDIEIDLAHGKLTFFQPDGCRKSELAYWAKVSDYREAALSPSASESDKRSFVDVIINGTKLRALLDSGATITVLSRHAAERVGFDLNAPGVKAGGRMGGVGAKTYATWIVPIATFSVGTETINHSQMQVIDSSFGDGTTDMLLGVDFMLAHHMYIANSQHKIYFTYNGGRVFTLDKASIGANEPASDGDGADVPTTAADYALRGQAWLSRGEVANAHADLDAAIRLDPKNAAYFLSRARILVADRQYDAALADLDTSLGIESKNLDALLLRANLRYRKKDRAGVESDIAAARQLAPTGSNQSFAVAQVYINIDRPADALPLLDDWIAAHGSDAALGNALQQRCWARALANQSLDDALSDCRKAIKHDGAQPAYLDALGLVYLRRGNNADAIKAYRQALAESSNRAWSHYGLGLAELRSGQTDAGRAELAMARFISKGLDARAAKLGLLAAGAAPASSAPDTPSSK